MYQGVPPVPDTTFRKKLREFDPSLHCVFERSVERFVIQKDMPVGRPYTIWVVCGMANEFRQPDERDLQVLYDGDLWRHGGVKERISSGERYMTDYNQASLDKAAEELRNVTKDDKYQLRRALRQANNDGKANHEFRRIEPKSKGYTVKDLRKTSKSDC